jgi:gamma-glutamyltranspeptidase / glutathione hydrolase
MAPSTPPEHLTRPELTGTVGMVASTHWLASGAGMAVLEAGGNAFDAAVAAGLVLQVVEPHLNGPGGDLPILLWDAAAGRPHVVCGQGVAPAAATIDRFRELGLSLVPGSGLLAATVPGAFGAWTLMLERWGTWELADVASYAVHYAETGWPVLPAISATISTVAEMFRQCWPTSARTWLVDGRAPAPGTTMTSPQLARTYRRLVAAATGSSREQRIANARAAWYQGFVAEEIGTFCTTAWRDSSGRDHAGLLTSDDLARWSPTVEEPVRGQFADRFEILKTPAWGQGPVLVQQLQLLQSLGISDVPLRSADGVHLVVESAKLAFADREAWYGDDPDVPIEALLSPAYARTRAALVAEDADLHLRPGSPAGQRPRLPAGVDTAGTGPAFPAPDSALGEPTLGPWGESRGDTCHLDVGDRWGNLVSATPSGGWLHSSPVVPGLGFGLGTRAQMFFLDPGLSNSLRPGKRPRTTLSPTLVLRDGDPWLACGTPGGDQQDQWQVPFLLDVMGGMGLQAAIDAPTWHTTHFPSSFDPHDAHPGHVLVEDRLGDEVIAALAARGHRVQRAGPWRLGRLSAVARDGAWLRAAANSRGAQGYAAGR